MNNIELLKKLGMSEYEARAYLALAKLGPSTVKEIVTVSKLPRNKAYEALQKLDEKNKVMSLPLSPKKYKITHPEIFKQEIKEMETSVSSLIKLIESPKINEFKEMFWVIRGRMPTIEKLEVENAKCTKEILSCSVLNHMPYKNLRTIKEVVKRGVKVKFITPFDPKDRKYYEQWIKAGVEIRSFNSKEFGSLFPRITILDSTKARLTVGIPEVKKEEEYITLWTESKAFASMLKYQFTTMWKKGTPIEKLITSQS